MRKQFVVDITFNQISFFGGCVIYTTSAQRLQRLSNLVYKEKSFSSCGAVN